MSATFDTVVVGAGHNGLVTAAYLARAGQRVLVLERRDVVGGAAATEEVFPGFRVDTGAHRLGGLLAPVVEDLRLRAHGLELLPADPCVFAPSEAGPPLVVWRDPRRTADALRAVSRRDADAWLPFTELLGSAASIVEAVWTTTPPDVTGTDLRDLLGAVRLGRKLRHLGKKDMVEVLRALPMSLYELVEEWFESDLIRGTLAAAATTGLCQGPMGAGTAYTLVHRHVGAGAGVVLPTIRVRGGTGRLSEALLASCRSAGGEVRTGSAVKRVLVEGRGAVGVSLASGEQVRATRVVSSADPRTTFFELVDPGTLDVEFARKVSNIRFRGATAKVHLALAGLPDFTCLPGAGPHLEGVVSIAPSLEYVERAYDDAKYGRCSAEPVVEVSIPSLTDPTVAPEGRHLASMVVHYTPYRLRAGEWDEGAREELADAAIRSVSRYAPGFESLVEDQHVQAPPDLEQRFGLAEGNIHHGEMTLDQLLFMRPVPGAARYRTPIEGLWLCGAGSHPGGGVTGVPGFNAAREILRG